MRNYDILSCTTPTDLIIIINEYIPLFFSPYILIFYFFFYPSYSCWGFMVPNKISSDHLNTYTCTFECHIQILLQVFRKKFLSNLICRSLKIELFQKNYCWLSISKSVCNKVLEKLNVFVLNIQEILHTPLNI